MGVEPLFGPDQIPAVVPKLPDSPIVGVDPPRTDADVWDDRIRMLGAVIIAILLISLSAWLAIAAPQTQNVGMVIGGFISSIPTVVRYFMSAGGK